MTILVYPALVLLSLFYYSFSLLQPEGCTNSCCMNCTEETCPVCYRLNTNPVMCPCVDSEAVEKIGTVDKQEASDLLSRLRIKQSNVNNNKSKVKQPKIKKYNRPRYNLGDSYTHYSSLFCSLIDQYFRLHLIHLPSLLLFQHKLHTEHVPSVLQKIQNQA